MSNSNNNPGNKPETANSDKEQAENTPSPDFHGAAIIDDEGNEIPITEEMIKKACDDLDNKDDTK